jgi:hypothetical protein
MTFWCLSSIPTRTNENRRKSPERPPFQVNRTKVSEIREKNLHVSLHLLSGPACACAYFILIIIPPSTYPPPPHSTPTYTDKAQGTPTSEHPPMSHPMIDWDLEVPATQGTNLKPNGGGGCCVFETQYDDYGVPSAQSSPPLDYESVDSLTRLGCAPGKTKKR